jgi:hypothetical protein
VFALQVGPHVHPAYPTVHGTRIWQSWQTWQCYSFSPCFALFVARK